MWRCRAGSRCGRTCEVFARLYGVADIAEPHRRARRRSSTSSIFSTARPASCRPASAPASALAKALINEPEVLLLDEPTASLDPDTADWVRARLERYRRERGATILLASHNMVEVERLCERVIIMKKGAIVDDDTPARAARALSAAQPGGGLSRRGARGGEARQAAP